MNDYHERFRETGKSVESYIEFFERAKKGENVRYMLLNGEILSPSLLAAERAALIEKVEGMRRDKVLVVKRTLFERGYRKALDDILTYLRT